MKRVNSDVAYAHIRQKILEGEYPPGHALMTETLSAEIGVSRTPVRDALHKLETDGLVVIQPRLGASVKKFDLADFRELCELRLALEVQTAGLAAQRRSEAELREIEQSMEDMRRLTPVVNAAKTEQPQMGELAQADVRFHVAILAAARNELLKREILRLHLIHRVALPGRKDMRADTRAERDRNRIKTLAEHEKIFAAIARSDAAGAKQAMEAHLQILIDRVLQWMAQEMSAGASGTLTEAELAYHA